MGIESIVQEGTKGNDWHMQHFSTEQLDSNTGQSALSKSVSIHVQVVTAHSVKNQKQETSGFDESLLEGKGKGKGQFDSVTRKHPASSLGTSHPGILNSYHTKIPDMKAVGALMGQKQRIRQSKDE